MAVLGAFTPFGVLLTDDNYNALKSKVSPFISVFFPPYPSSPHFIRWAGGFYWGVHEALQSLVDVPATVLSVLRVIKYLLTRPIDKIFNDLSAVVMRYPIEFISSISAEWGKTYYERAKDLGVG